MKLLISFGLLVAVSASPVPDQPQIQQGSEQGEVDQSNAFFILKSIKNDLDGLPGNFKEEDSNKDAVNVLNTIKEILTHEVNEGDDSDTIKVEEIAKNNGLDHINRELLNHQNDALSDDNSDENKAQKNILWSPVQILRSDSVFNNVDDPENENKNLEDVDDQYELKIAGFVPHIDDVKNDSDQTPNFLSKYDLERLFDRILIRIPQLFQIKVPEK